MRAMQLVAPSQALQAVDLPTPSPAPGEILLRVSACAVCRTDLQLCDGDLEAHRMPIVPGHQVVGRVEAFGGARPWMQMTLHDSTARGRVRCLVVTDDGVTHLVGSFVASEGYGAWSAPLHVNPKDVRSAEVVSASGAVIATAPLA